MSDIQVIGARGIPNVEGGAEKHAEKLFPLFAKVGYAVQLLGISRYCVSKDFKDVLIKRIPTISFLKTDKVVYNLLAVFYACFTRPRIVHLQCLNSALFLVLYKLAGLKVVMRYGSSDYEFDKWGGVQRWVLRLCEYQLRYADHVITVSDTFRRALISRHGLKRVSVIPNGLDPAVVSPAALRFHTTLGLDGCRYVLSVGRVTPDKSFETLVTAFEKLNDSEIQLIVAGGLDKGYGEKFQAQENPRIRFIGRVDRDLLSALYANCTAYVNCSRHEGLSNAILEALSHRAPIMLSDIPANIEMALPEHHYFPTGDANQLSAQLLEVQKDPERFVAPTDRFSDWSDVFHKTHAVYASVAPRHFKSIPVSDAVPTSVSQTADSPATFRG